MPDNRTNNLVGNVFSFLIYIYMIPAFLIFVPYFNWQYAQEHGFVSWLVLGEVVPTLQATIWPYYVVKHYTKPAAPTWTQSEKENIQHMSASVRSALAAADITKTKPVGTLSNEDIASILQLDKTAVREAQQVLDSVLDKMHPDFRQHFRNEYQKSLEIRIQSIEQHDGNLENQGRALAGQWSDWLNAHRDEINQAEE